MKHSRQPGSAVSCVGPAAGLRRPARFAGRPAGFSLIELLVVITIILILMAMLFPVASSLKERLRRFMCMSNQRQIAIGMMLFVADNQFYPGSYGAENGVVSCIWAPRIRKYAKDNGIFYCPSRDPGYKWQLLYGSGSGYALTNSEWDYYPGEKTLATCAGILFSYGWNDWGSHNCEVNQQHRSGYGLGGDIRCGVNVNELPVASVISPVNMIAIGDALCDPGYWNFNMDPDNPTEYPGKPHNFGANIVFADGHVEWFLQAALVRANNASWEYVARRWNNDHQP